MQVDIFFNQQLKSRNISILYFVFIQIISIVKMKNKCNRNFNPNIGLNLRSGLSARKALHFSFWFMQVNFIFTTTWILITELKSQSNHQLQTWEGQKLKPCYRILLIILKPGGTDTMYSFYSTNPSPPLKYIYFKQVEPHTVYLT